MSKPATSSAAGEENPSAGGKSRARMSLGPRLAASLSVALVAAIAILFLPAGTWKFWQGWALLAAFFLPTAFIFFYFYKHDPQVAERRLQNKETVGEQKLLIQWGRPFFFAAFLLPGFDYRWGWSRALLGAVPLWLTLLSLAMVFLGVFWVLKANSFASRTIQVEAGQTVISNGRYRLVRRPSSQWKLAE